MPNEKAVTVSCLKASDSGASARGRSGRGFGRYIPAVRELSGTEDGRLDLDGVSGKDTIEHRDSSGRSTVTTRNLGVASILVLAIAVGWLIGRGGQASLPPTRVVLSIEHLTGGASVTDSSAAPTIAGFILVEDPPTGTTVDSITWGGLANRVTGSASPIEVTIQTKVDCRIVSGSGQPFPPMTADLVAADGTRKTLPVTVISNARWQNVLDSCLDPTHPAATNK